LVVCPQKFIVKYLIIIFTQDCHIYTQTERRGKGLAAGETERESVRETESGCKKTWRLLKKRLLKEGLTIMGFPEKLFNGEGGFAKIH
jgi:hypothetical protein